MVYKCEYCNQEIKFPKGEEFVPILIIEYYGITSWFCCSECRRKFIDKCIKDAQLDKAGHIIK